MAKNNISRRAILQGLGLSAAYLPLLSTHRALAQTGSKTAANLVLIAWPNGCLDFHAPPEGPLVVPQDDLAPLKPLTPWRDRVSVLGGLDIRNLQDLRMGGGHAAMPFVYTGVPGAEFAGRISDGVPRTAGGPSLDYYLATKLAEAEGKRPDQLHLAQRTHRLNGDDIYLSFKGAPIGGRPNAVQPFDDPVELFDRYFATLNVDEAALKRLRAQKKSVLDYVGKSLERSCSRLGSEDRQRCEAHLTAVRDYEKLATNVAACTPPPAPQRGRDYRAELYNPLVPEIHRMQMAMLSVAFSCGLARTASLQWVSSHNNQYRFQWLANRYDRFGQALPGEIGDTGGGGREFHHHTIAHNEGQTIAGIDFPRMKRLVDQWFIQQFADLLAAFDAVKEPGGSLLDRTIVVMTNLQRTGGGHQLDDVPVLIGGNAGGYFKQGQHIRWVSGRGAGNNLPMNALLREVCLAMGVPEPPGAFGQYGGTIPALRARA